MMLCGRDEQASASLRGGGDERRKHLSRGTWPKLPKGKSNSRISSYFYLHKHNLFQVRFYSPLLRKARNE